MLLTYFNHIKRYVGGIPFLPLRISLYLVSIAGISQFVNAQKGLEGIFVETYYISDSRDSTDILSGQHLPEGSITYRIYADLAPDYKLQMVYGTEGHALSISTTTNFFNNYRGGFGKGNYISRVKLGEHTVPIDSWVTVGACSQHHHAVPKHLDPDTSVVGGKYNDGGSARIEGGLLVNADQKAGIPLTEKDGYVELPAPKVIFYNLEPEVFVKRQNEGLFYTEDGVFGVLEGVRGVTEENMVLLAQITTNGELAFELNLQLLAPYGGVERFVAKNPDGSEFTHPELIYPRKEDN
jgi:hypothetical protein